MSCPAGQFYSEKTKMCLPLKMKPMSRGKSLVPCPEGQVWNPDENVRRCVRKNLYKMIYGPEKAAVASLDQKKLRQLKVVRPKKTVKTAKAVKANSIKKAVKANTTKKTVSPKKAVKSVKEVVVRSSLKGAITPALKETLPLKSAEPSKNSVMIPGLLREDMVKWIRNNCKNQEDPIMLEPYEEADLRDLRSLVRLGSGFCYTADVLDHHVRSSIERDVPVKDIMNPSYRLDANDYGALKVAATTLQKGYKLPSEPTEKPAAHYKLFIGVAGEPEFKVVFLFDERKVKKLPGGGQEFTGAIPDGGWIGWIPAKGTADLEKLIREAFSRGRMFTKADRPFKCCRVHLKKDKAHWSDGVAGKIKSMEEEIKGLL